VNNLNIKKKLYHLVKYFLNEILIKLNISKKKIIIQEMISIRYHLERKLNFCIKAK